MLNTNTNFDTKHALDYKTPIYIVTFSRSGWSPSFSSICNHNATDTSYKRLIGAISGGQQNVTPEKGTASISGFTIHAKDGGGDILSLIASDSAQMQNVDVDVVAGYRGMAEADLIKIAIGNVTGLKLSGDHTAWIFTAADPGKKLQKHIAWGASDASPVTYQGNPINLLLQILTSTGAGTNGDYDVLPAAYAVGIDESMIAVSELEAIRDDWFPGTSHNLSFSLTDHVKAKDFIENEILKILNCYPKIDGNGRYSVVPFKPTSTVNNIGTVQEITEEMIISWDIDLNFRELINEVEVKYDWDGDDFQTVENWIDGTSINLRSYGRAPFTIESKGLKSSYNPAADEIAANRKSRIFARYKTPPLKISIKTHFSRWLTEAGDIVPVTHSKIPDPINGTVGIVARDMEVIKRSVDWIAGVVSFDLVETGFSSQQYAVISPCMTIISSASSTSFLVSVADAAKFLYFTNPEVKIHNLLGAVVATVTITAQIWTAFTCDDIGQTPAAGWTVRFAGYDSVTTEQKKYGYLSDSSGYLGAANDDGHLIIP